MGGQKIRYHKKKKMKWLQMKKGISSRLNVPYVLSKYIHIQIDGAFVGGLYGSERAGMVALGIVIKS